VQLTPRRKPRRPQTPESVWRSADQPGGQRSPSAAPRHEPDVIGDARYPGQDRSPADYRPGPDGKRGAALDDCPGRDPERDGFVARRGDPSDKRVVLIELTAAGTDLVRSRRRADAQAFAQLIEELPSDETAALLAALPALEHLRELEDVQRARTTRLHDQQAGR
jgi:hypothetical protein